jgi:hypothetical protein
VSHEPYNFVVRLAPLLLCPCSLLFVSRPLTTSSSFPPFFFSIDRPVYLTTEPIVFYISLRVAVCWGRVFLFISRSVPVPSYRFAARLIAF